MVVLLLVGMETGIHNNDFELRNYVTDRNLRIGGCKMQVARGRSELQVIVSPQLTKLKP